MKQHLAILLWATSPEFPHLCATPFFHAAAASAMDVEVEIYFAGKSVQLLVPGTAKSLYAGHSQEISIYDHMSQALAHGARFLVCRDALDANRVDAEHVISGVAGFAGAAAFMGRVLDPEWVTLTY